MSEDLLQAMEDLRGPFQSAMDAIEKDQEEYWNSLSKDDQLKAFCAVVRRIYQAELVDQGSYRHALYSVFGFGPESYGQAQMAGYLALHNSIMGSDHDVKLLEAFCVRHGLNEKLAVEFLI
jgi:hypothetical protein